MNRENAPEELKWKLTDIFKTHQDWEYSFEQIKLLLPKISTFKNKLNDKNVLLEFYQFEEELSKKLEFLSSYCFLNSDIDNSNNQFIEDNQKLELLYSKISELSAYIEPELANLPDKYFFSLLDDEKFKNYNISIDLFLRTRHFVLSEKEEKALSTVDKFSDGFNNIYDSLTEHDFSFDPVVKKGKKLILTKSNYINFLEDKNKNIREQAYNNIYKTFKQFSKTLSLNYISFVKMCCSDLSLRKQKSYLESSFYSKKMPEKIYSNLIEQVDKNIKLEKEYFRLLKNKSNLKSFGFMDIYQSLAVKINKKYTISEQKNIVLESLKPLGDDYQSLVKFAFQNNWIDFCRDRNKSSGGYMLGVYDVHPFILLNNNDNYDSLSTLAHELGHAMHTYFSNKNQPYQKHSYSTFIAEIASTINEILLNKYMQKHAQSPEEKLFYLDNYMQSFKGTVFRQTMFSEFEDFAFKTIENDNVLSPEILKNKYNSLIKKHFGGVVKIDENINYEFLRIPHFYSPYYVFQYATSFISACYIANKILQGDKPVLESYKKMLCSGSNGYPTEILSIVGIDLTKNSTFDYAFNDLQKTLNETKTLIKSLKNAKKT